MFWWFRHGLSHVSPDEFDPKLCPLREMRTMLFLPFCEKGRLDQNGKSYRWLTERQLVFRGPLGMVPTTLSKP